MVEGAAFEKQYAGNRIRGSNPLTSAFRINLMKILSIETSCDETAISILEAESLPADRQGNFNDAIPNLNT